MSRKCYLDEDLHMCCCNCIYHKRITKIADDVFIGHVCVGPMMAYWDEKMGSTIPVFFFGKSLHGGGCEFYSPLMPSLQEVSE